MAGVRDDLGVRWCVVRRFGVGVPVDTTLPGGARLPTAAITRVGVLPTHRRQGVGKQLMERLVVDARERGRMLASLRATEAVIYPRFGFGVAGENASAVIDARRARPLRCPEIEGTFRILDRGEILDVVPELYEQSPTAGRA